MHPVGRLFLPACLAALLLLVGGCEAPPHQPPPRSGSYSGPPVNPAPYPGAYPNPQPPAYGYEEIRRCRADNQRAHADTVDRYERARRSGRINPAEAQQFNAMEAQLANFRAQLARDGISLQDCQRIGGAIARERDELIRMSRYDPGVARCVVDNRRAHDDIYAVYNNAQRTGRIRPDEAQWFQAMEKRLAAFQADVKRDGYTLADCQAVSRALVKERAVVNQMVVQ